MRRKQLRLRDFDYASPGGYFVTVCVRDRRPLLVGLVADKVQAVLVALPARFIGLVVDEHVLMDDHLHVIFILDGGTPRLPRIVQAFKSLTTGQVSAALRPLWQRGYYEHVIRDEDELQMVREYIRDNPLAAEIKIGR